MKNYEYILGIDPSGNKAEGNGCSGIALLDTLFQKFTLTDVKAKDYDTQHEYWHAIIQAVEHYVNDCGRQNLFVTIEDFRLDPSRALAQSYSAMETPKLIGILQYYLDTQRVPYLLQPASAVKKRWSEEILLKTGMLTCGGGDRKIWYYNGERTNDHERDALKHAWHTFQFKKYKGKVEV